MLAGNFIYNQQTAYFWQYISVSDVNVLELLLEIFMTYLLFHMLAIGIDYMPTCIYQYLVLSDLLNAIPSVLFSGIYFYLFIFLNSDLFPK